MITCVYLLLFYYLVLSVLSGLHTAFHHSHPHGLTHPKTYLRCDFLLARCSLYLAFCLAAPDPWAPVIYFFFLALVFTLSSLGPPFDAPLKVMPPSNILSKSSMICFLNDE